MNATPETEERKHLEDDDRLKLYLAQLAMDRLEHRDDLKVIVNGRVYGVRSIQDGGA